MTNKQREVIAHRMYWLLQRTISPKSEEKKCEDRIRAFKWYHSNKERSKEIHKRWRKNKPAMMCCWRCKKKKSKRDFYEHDTSCIDCALVRNRTNRRSLRRIVISHYCKGDPHCTARGCGVTCFEVLELDHINGDGKQNREKVGKSGQFFRWLINQNFPPIVKVLCANCHRARHRKVKWF
jgi:hypothetical protein